MTEHDLSPQAFTLLDESTESVFASTPTDLYFLESRLLPMLPALRASQNVLQRLRYLYGPQSEHHVRAQDIQYFAQVVDVYSDQVQVDRNRVEVLLKRRESTAHLLEQRVSWNHQKVAQRQNDLTTSLTRSAAKDSVTIRVITVITLVFLSFTVVAVRYVVLLRNAECLAEQRIDDHGHAFLQRR